MLCDSKYAVKLWATVGRCRLTVSKSVLKAPVVSALKSEV